MRIFWILLFISAASAAAFCSPGGVLEKVNKIQVDPTVVDPSSKIDDSVAPSLVRYNLRAAVRDAHMEEGNSPIRAHIVLDIFSSESPVRKAAGMGSGRSTNTVDGKLVIQDANGKELASVKSHVHGSVAFSTSDADGDRGGHATSDLEQRLLKEIEALR